MANWVKVHPPVVRITHWINVLAVLVMVTSGWRIYNASPLFESFTFPDALTLGGWLAGALQWPLPPPVVARPERARLRDLRNLVGPLPPQAPADPAASGRARYLAGAARTAGARRPKRLQRSPARHVSGSHSCVRRASPFRIGDLEAGPAPGARGADGRLRGRALAPLFCHVARRLHRRGARSHGRARAAYLPHHDHRAAQEVVMKNSRLALKHPKVGSLERRLFLKQSLSIGALSLLAGCEITGDENVQQVLEGMSQWNDRVQGWLFDPKKLAPEFRESMITQPFPFNGYYPESDVRIIDETDYKLQLGGLIKEQKPWRLPELYALPQVSQVTRHICVEGWSAIGKWSGVRFSDFLQRVGADLTAKYVGFNCGDDYYSSIDMATALHPQTLLTFRFADQILPPKYGFPMKLRIPTKLGFKNPKHITELFVVNDNPGGYWEDKGYNWFSGN